MVGFRSLSKSIYNDFNCSVCLNTLPSWGSLEGECGWLVKWFQTSHVGEVVFRIFYTIWNFSGWKTGGNKIFSSRSSQPIILWVFFFPTEAKQDVLWSLWYYTWRFLNILSHASPIDINPSTIVFSTPTILSGLYSSDGGDYFQRLYFNCLSTHVSTIRVDMAIFSSNDMYTITCQVPPRTGDEYNS